MSRFLGIILCLVLFAVACVFCRIPLCFVVVARFAMSAEEAAHARIAAVDAKHTLTSVHCKESKEEKDGKEQKEQKRETTNRSDECYICRQSNMYARFFKQRAEQSKSLLLKCQLCQLQVHEHCYYETPPSRSATTWQCDVCVAVAVHKEAKLTCKFPTCLHADQEGPRKTLQRASRIGTDAWAHALCIAAHARERSNSANTLFSSSLSTTLRDLLDTPVLHEPVLPEFMQGRFVMVAAVDGGTPLEKRTPHAVVWLACDAPSGYHSTSLHPDSGSLVSNVNTVHIVSTKVGRIRDIRILEALMSHTIFPSELHGVLPPQMAFLVTNEAVPGGGLLAQADVTSFVEHLHRGCTEPPIRVDGPTHQHNAALSPDVISLGQFRFQRIIPVFSLASSTSSMCSLSFALNNVGYQTDSAIVQVWTHSRNIGAMTSAIPQFQARVASAKSELDSARSKHLKTVVSAAQRLAHYQIAVDKAHMNGRRAQEAVKKLQAEMEMYQPFVRRHSEAVAAVQRTKNAFNAANMQLEQAILDIKSAKSEPKEVRLMASELHEAEQTLRVCQELLNIQLGLSAQDDGHACDHKQNAKVGVAEGELRAHEAKMNKIPRIGKERKKSQQADELKTTLDTEEEKLAENCADVIRHELNSIIRYIPAKIPLSFRQPTFQVRFRDLSVLRSTGLAELNASSQDAAHWGYNRLSAVQLRADAQALVYDAIPDLRRKRQVAVSSADFAIEDLGSLLVRVYDEELISCLVLQGDVDCNGSG